jgi:peptide/nickel transport system permease protein
MAQLTRMTRSAMLEVNSQDFIRVCRAKGLGEGSVILKHALRNAIAPVVTVAGLQLGYLFGSIIVVETLFNFTGMGWLTFQALNNRDIPLIQATIFVIAAVFMLSNLIVDLIYAALDPRINFD